MTTTTRTTRASGETAPTYADVAAVASLALTNLSDVATALAAGRCYTQSAAIWRQIAILRDALAVASAEIERLQQQQLRTREAGQNE